MGAPSWIFRICDDPTPEPMSVQHFAGVGTASKTASGQRSLFTDPLTWAPAGSSNQQGDGIQVPAIRMQRPQVATTENRTMGKIGQRLIAAILIAAAAALASAGQVWAQGAVRSVHNDWQV